MKTRFLLWWATLALGSGTVHAQMSTAVANTPGPPAVMDADKLDYDRATGVATGEGNVVIRYRDAVLRSHRVRFNPDTQEAWAEGDVRVEYGGMEWTAPAIYYHFGTRQLKTSLARSYIDKLYICAEDVSSDRTNRLSIASASATTCDYEHPHYRLVARRAEIWPGNRVNLYGVTLYAGTTPVFWFPVVAVGLPIESPPFVIRPGYTSDWGAFMLTTSHWQINSNVAAALQMDLRTARGVGTGPEVQYRYGTAKGLLRGYYLYDTDPIDKRDKASGEYRSANRYVARWEHKQLITDDLTLTARFNLQRDRDVYEDYFEREYRAEMEPSSVADLTYRRETFLLSAQVRPEFNHFFAEVQRLPEVKLAVNRTRLFRTPFFYEGETSAGYYNNDPGDTGDLLFTGDTVRADTFHQILAPFTVHDWVAVVPHAGVRASYYLDAPAGADDTNEVRRVCYNAGVETSFKLWRQWDNVSNERWKINGLRHIIQPYALYQWMDEPNVRPGELYPFDTVRFATVGNRGLPVTRYVPHDFPAFNAIDALDELNVVRFGVRQRLQTRRGGVTWNLADLDVWTDYHFNDRGGAEKWGDHYGRLRLRPTKWAFLDADLRYSRQTDRLEEANTALRVLGGDRWAAGFSTRYLRDDSNLVSGDIAWQFARYWLFRIYHRYDIEQKRWEEQEYVLRQELHDWFINYGLRFREGSANDPDDFTVFVAFTLKAYPQIKFGIN